MEFIDKIIKKDSLEGLKELPDNSVDCCVTSPPYYNMRDYGVDGQIGLEQTPIEYVERIADVFQEVFRILKPTGTLWLNIGDTYNGTKLGNTNAKCSYINSNKRQKKEYKGCKHKDLLGIPWMVAFALRDKVGFYLRNDIIWSKGNPMPEPVKDRCVKSHEYIFLMSKSQRYYFDYEAIQEPATSSTKPRMFGAKQQNGTMRNDIGNTYKPRTKNCMENGQKHNTMHLQREAGLPDEQYIVRNKRSVWSVNTHPDTVAHFATYPEKLIEPCILAGCPKDGIVLDPFMGSGTTAKVAQRFGRHYVGFELNPEYIKIAERKLCVVQQELFV